MGIGHHWYCHVGDQLMLWLIRVLASLGSNIYFLFGYLVVNIFKSGQKLILSMRQNDFFWWHLLMFLMLGRNMQHGNILLNIVLFYLCEGWHSWIGASVFVWLLLLLLVIIIMYFNSTWLWECPISLCLKQFYYPVGLIFHS